MTREQLEYIFAQEGINTNPLDLEDLRRKLEIIWYDNCGHFFNDYDDKRHVLEEFNLEQETFTVYEFNKGTYLRTYSNFDCIQKIVFRAEIKEGCDDYLTRNAKGWEGGLLDRYSPSTTETIVD